MNWHYNNMPNETSKVKLWGCCDRDIFISGPEFCDLGIDCSTNAGRMGPRPLLKGCTYICTKMQGGGDDKNRISSVKEPNDLKQ